MMSRRVRVVAVLTLILASVVAVTGFALYTTAALPYQDPTPALLARQDDEVRFGLMLLAGGLVVAAASASWLWRTAAPGEAASPQPRSAGFVLRWLAALLSPAVGVAVTIATTLLFVAGLERMCPRELMVSGMCTAPWYPPAEQAAFTLGSFLGAIVFVSLPAAFAPAFKQRVAWIAWLAGFVIASLFLFQAGATALPLFVGAVVGGALGVFLRKA